MINFRDIPMFSNLDKKFHKELKDNIFKRKYTKDSTVFFEGDESNYLYIILEGTVRLYKTSPKGTEVHINFLKAPNVIGEYACFEKEPFPATCEFTTDGVMGLLSFEKVDEYLYDKDFSLGIIKSLTKKIMIISKFIHQETILSADAKVAHLMRENIDIFNTLKKNEVARNLNLTPETFSRTVTKFKNESIVINENGELKVLNYEALDTIIDTNSVKNCINCIADFKRKLKRDGKL